MDWFQIIRDFLAAVIVLLLPGAALLAWLPGHAVRSAPVRRQDGLSWLADAAALSIAGAGLVGLIFFLVGLRVGGLAVIGLYAVCLLALLAALLKRTFSLPSLKSVLAAGAGVLLLAAMIGWRFYQARELALPAWTDSVQHVLVVRKIIEYGGVPPTLTPYLDVPFYYHYGFHLIAALLAFFSGLPADRAVLVFGNVLNAGVSLSVYRAALVFEAQTGTKPERAGPVSWAAAAAALLVTFSFQMPAYYLTWGRYTLLTGLMLLGPLLAATAALWQTPRDWGAWMRLGLLTTGAALTHYFVLLLVGLFWMVLGGFWLIRGLLGGRLRRLVYWQPVLWVGAAALVGILFAFPWLLRVYEYSRANATVQVVSPVMQDSAAQKSAADYLNYLGYLLGPRRNHILLGLAGLGLIAALRRPDSRRLAAWAALLGVLSLPWGVRFGPFRPDHYAIVLFFPAGILLGMLLADGAAALGRVSRPWVGWLGLVTACGLLVYWGGLETRGILNSTTIFATQADVAALEWVKANTSPAARFYINNTHWQYNVNRGVDGGYWLLPYTGRFSLVPPIPYAWGSPESIRLLNGWADRSQKLEGCTPDFWSLARDAGLTHVYLRQGQGNLKPEALAECARLRLIYQQMGVYIYEIRPPG